MGEGDWRERAASVHNEAIAWKCREDAPASTHSMHRRCMRAYMRGIAGDKVQSLACFSCACSFPWVEGRRGNNIDWAQPFRTSRRDPERVAGLMGIDALWLEDTLGKETFLAIFLGR